MVLRVLILLLLLAGSSGPAPAGTREPFGFLDIEAGVAISGYNTVRIPGETGTRFSLTGELESDAAPAVRFRVGTEWGGRHHLSLFAAPLTIHAQGRLDRDLRFDETTFPAGAAIEGTYRFDSYRLTYRYRVLDRDRVRLQLGVTAKIRAAEIALDGNGMLERYDNVGFVPLLAFRFDWSWSRSTGLVIEGDALAGGPGRAEDVFAGIETALSPRLGLKGGYRILEGGADVPDVYTFALVHYALVGLVARF